MLWPPTYLYRDYFKAKVYTTWAHGPLGIGIFMRVRSNIDVRVPYRIRLAVEFRVVWGNVNTNGMNPRLSCAC